MLTPAIRAICSRPLALPLLVSRIRADHQDRTVAADDLALFAHRLYGSSDLHRSGFVSTTGLPHAPGIGRQAQLTGLIWPTGKDSRGRASGRAWVGGGGLAPGGIEHRACGAVQLGARLRRAPHR